MNNSTVCATTRILAISATLVLCGPASAFAQLGFEELSVGVGGIIERGPNATAVVGGIGLGPLLIEGEYGPLSDAEPCRQAGKTPDNCDDGIVIAGFRHRFRPITTRVRPFVNLLGGTYFRGSGMKDPEFVSEHVVIQTGGGVDVRRPTSKHGVRLSLNYRHVFSDQRRNQLRFLVVYFLSVAVRT